jgi:hypothetical protein
LHIFANHSVWKGRREDERTLRWTIPGLVELDLWLGSGQIRQPYSTQYEEFEDHCGRIGFSAGFLRELRAKQPLYQCKIHRNGANKPAILELAISVYETDSIFILVRYDITGRLLKGLVFTKEVDKLATCPLTFRSLERFLDERRDDAASDPLMIITTLLSFLEMRSHEPVRWRDSILALEGRLGVTRRREHLDELGYPEPSDRFAFLNAQQASLALELHDAGAAARSIALLLGRISRLVRLCEGVGRCPSPVELATECREVTARLYVLQVDMCAADVTTLEGGLYNRMGEAYNQTMKGIAVIGLVFLPTMLVSGVFQAGSGGGQGSSGSGSYGLDARSFWSLFMSLCAALTVLMIAAWVAWERCGYRWMEQIRNLEVEHHWKQDRELYSVACESELRSQQLSRSAQPIDSRHRAICTNRRFCIDNKQRGFYRQ